MYVDVYVCVFVLLLLLWNSKADSRKYIKMQWTSLIPKWKSMERQWTKNSEGTLEEVHGARTYSTRR